MKTAVCQRLAEFIENVGLSKTMFAKSIGLKQSTFSNQIVGGNITFDAVLTILNVYPQLSAEWLLRGTGSMLTGNQNGNSLSVNTMSGGQLSVGSGCTNTYNVNADSDKDKRIAQLEEMVRDKNELLEFYRNRLNP